MDIGTGIAIAFGTSSFSAELLALNGNDISREDIDTTHMGTTAYRTFMPSALVDGGTIEMEFGFDPDEQPPIEAAPETITITFPLPSGMSTAATLAFTGYINSWSWGAPLEDKMTGTATMKVDGLTDPVWTDAAA